MRDNNKAALRPVLQALLQQTEGCRDDMHEPDEQEVTARVRGRKLDNAMGADPETNNGELTVGIKRNGVNLWFNLADLIALARVANLGDPVAASRSQEPS